MTQGMQKKDLCLVTGISGYVASWIAKDLLEQGYRVRGTVRSLNDGTKLQTMRQLLPGAEFVEADLRSSAGWDTATAGVRWVFHVASPQAVASETDRTGGATSGTQHVLTAAFASGTVEKVVMTSSDAAVAYNLPSSKKSFSEDDWTNADGAGDYFRSKTLAEQLAWQMTNDETQNPRHVALSTINPCMILGPSLVPWVRYSHETIKNVAEGKTTMFPDMTTYFVDVRDVAAMHIAIMNDPSTNGHRHLCYSVKGRNVDLATSIRDMYANLGFVPSTRTYPHLLMWALKSFSPDVASIYPLLGKETLRVTKYPATYHYQYRDFTQMVRDTMDDLLKKRAIQPPDGKAQVDRARA